MYRSSVVKVIYLTVLLGKSLFLPVMAQEDSVSIKPSSFSIYPALSYSPETGAGYGAIAFYVLKGSADKEKDQYYRPTSISPYILFTSKKQILSSLDIDLFLKNGVNLNGRIRYFNFPDFFYGTGNDTNPETFEQYTDQFFRINGRAMKPVSDDVFVGFTYDFQHNSIKEIVPGGLVDTNSPNGINGGRNFGIGPGILVDTRNSTLYPSRGHFLNASVSVFTRFIGSEYNYVSYLLDFRKYMKLLSEKNLITFQFRANLNSGSDIPFYKLAKLGGDERLRGIEHKNLYQDKQSVYFQVEGRQELFWRLGGVIFAGVGQVANSIGNFSGDNMRFVYGLGGRFRALKDEKLNIRIDLGFTDNGQNALYLSVREAF